MSSFILPVDLPVSSPFGPRGGGFHSGIDFSDGVVGHPIRAVADGVVVFNAFEAGGLGHTVTLQHDGIKSGYGHMLEPSPLPVGTEVRQGDVVGIVGSTGASTGPHLHFWMGQNPNVGAVDPAPFLAGAVAFVEDDLPDEATFKLWVREVLDEGTGVGQPGWAGTSAATLGATQHVMNLANEAAAKVDALAQGLASSAGGGSAPSFRLSDDDVQRIAAAVLDLRAQRLGQGQ